MIVLLLKACLCVFLSQFSLSTPLHRHHDLKRRHGAAAEEEVSLPILDADHFNSRSVGNTFCRLFLCCTKHQKPALFSSAPLEKFPCHDWTAQLRLERRHLLQVLKCELQHSWTNDQCVIAAGRYRRSNGWPRGPCTPENSSNELLEAQWFWASCEQIRSG